ncbi:hypothetical protein KC19_11G048700 [Ceratodon purpureus]|uniref:Uncharacterized protein n=1 Tax=Ceratodon purpureus TaxID=3225 RepID=A0A8T0GDE5_CERPU|nr:hypothetical protein KC19_11G048700 [Ceratodon purpureus]
MLPSPSRAHKSPPKLVNRAMPSPAKTPKPRKRDSTCRRRANVALDRNEGGFEGKPGIWVKPAVEASQRKVAEVLATRVWSDSSATCAGRPRLADAPLDEEPSACGKLLDGPSWLRVRRMILRVCLDPLNLHLVP